MVLCELTMFPTDKGISVSPYVARILAHIDASGLTYQLTPMSTILEGEFDTVMAVVAICFHELEKDCERINVSMKMDFRAGTQSRMRSKIEKVQGILGKELRR